MDGDGQGDRWRWAEALAIERIHGDDAPRWIAERVGGLALVGDAAGVERFRQIARRYEHLLSDEGLRGRGDSARQGS